MIMIELSLNFKTLGFRVETQARSNYSMGWKVVSATVLNFFPYGDYRRTSKGMYQIPQESRWGQCFPKLVFVENINDIEFEIWDLKT